VQWDGEWIDMDAFDAAWAVSKMPLDYDSIVEDDRGGFSADFIDPKTGGRYDMVARNWREHRDFPEQTDIDVLAPGKGGRVALGRFTEVDDKSKDLAMQSAYRHVGLPPVGTTYPLNVRVSDDTRRRGVASAIYDLMNEIQERRGGKGLVTQSAALNSDSLPFWASILGRDLPDDMKRIDRSELLRYPSSTERRR
tara:strand:+ start:138 stop:722 length:585 start_codon:yes stop_codon:yes gene_type:complete